MMTKDRMQLRTSRQAASDFLMDMRAYKELTRNGTPPDVTTKLDPEGLSAFLRHFDEVYYLMTASGRILKKYQEHFKNADLDHDARSLIDRIDRQLEGK
jgi:hypothetical protein